MSNLEKVIEEMTDPIKNSNIVVQKTNKLYKIVSFFRKKIKENPYE
jgi:hypothetical protein